MANPDITCILTDAQYKEAFAAYLGLPSPCARPFVGQFIGHPASTSNGAMQIDPYGVAITNCILPGYGWRHVHDRMVHLITCMARFAKFQTVTEAATFFNGLVPEPILHAYYERYGLYSNRSHAPGTIIPDVLIRDYPVSAKQTASGIPTTGTAILEIKRVGLTSQFYPISKRGTETRAAAILKEYNNS